VSADAIAAVTEAFRIRLEQAVGVGEVYVGPPVAADVGPRRAALFLFHLEPNRELRNTERLTMPPPGAPPPAPSTSLDALPLDLRYLISVFRRAGGGGVADPNELTTLGQVVQILHAQPTLGGALLAGQEVRLTPEPYPMEELSRVWGLFPQTSYRTSVVYLATPIFIEAAPIAKGQPVEEWQMASGVSETPPDLFGDRALRGVGS
jgi:hypothetical protein